MKISLLKYNAAEEMYGAIIQTSTEVTNTGLNKAFVHNLLGLNGEPESFLGLTYTVEGLVADINVT